MSKEDIIRMAREAGLEDGWAGWCQECGCDSDKLTRFAALVAAAECEKVARWMIRNGYATGHGDTTEDLLDELEWQIAERK